MRPTWQADTIFGNLCWIMAWREGEKALAQFLQGYKNGDPVFVLSDGMPGDLIPSPAHLSLMTPESRTFDDFQKAKKLKKIAWLTPNEFASVQKGNKDIERGTEVD